MRTRLQIRLFGGAAFQLDGEEPLRFRSHRTEPMLAYLLLNPGVVSREWLASFLWDDRTQEQSLANLRALLARLPKELKPFLQITRQSVAFERSGEGVWLDVDLFNEQLGVLLAEGARFDQAERLAGLRRASQLGAEHFLAGFYIEDGRGIAEWMAVMREQFRQKQLQLLEGLSRYYLYQQKFSVGIEYGQRLVALEPWREDSYRLLMRLYAQNGQRQAALKLFAACQQMLTEEFDLQPERETLELVARIRTAPLMIPHQLPQRMTPFVGRAAAERYVQGQLDEPHCRLVTLTGLGGVGKSRLAVQVADKRRGMYLHGIYFVPLATVAGVQDIPLGVAEALGMQLRGQMTVWEQVLDYLRGKEVLLVVDNFEPFLLGDDKREAVGLVHELMQEAPYVDLLVTSRQRLYLQGEWVYEVAGLSYPAEGEVVGGGDYEAFDFWALCAQRHGVMDVGAAEEVARICQLTGGMPLALEMAAACLERVGVAEIGEMIAQNVLALESQFYDLPPRQRTMQAVFDYSWQFLEGDEREKLAGLSLFRGVFTAEAAVAVTGVSEEQLMAWAGASWVMVVKGEDDGRYFELHPLVQQYLARQLADEGEMLARYVDYYKEMLVVGWRRLQGEEQLAEVAALGRAMPNWRQMWALAVAGACGEVLAEVVPGLGLWHMISGRYQAGKRLLAAAWEEVGGNGRLRAYLGAFAGMTGDYETAKAHLQAAVGEVAEESYDAPFCHNYLGEIARWQSDYERALACHERAQTLAAQYGYVWEELMALSGLGSVYYHRGDSGRAYEYYEACYQLSRQHQIAWVESQQLKQMGVAKYRLGAYDEAVELFNQALALYNQLGDSGNLAPVYNNLGIVADVRGDYALAKQYYMDSLHWRQVSGERRGLVLGYINLGVVNTRLGAYAEAIQNLQAGLLLSRELADTRRASLCLTSLGIIAEYEGRWAEAEAYYEEGLSLRAEIDDRRSLGWSYYHLGTLATKRGQLEGAKGYLDKSLELRQALNDHWGLLFTLCGLGDWAVADGDWAAGEGYFLEALELADKNPAVQIRVVLGLAAVRVKREEVDVAAGWLRVVLGHPAAEYHCQERARALLMEMEREEGEGLVAEIARTCLIDIVEGLLAKGGK
ncbi:MAG TPA: tetratricopeptide repeat protein [Anaerolineae bacterium]|nr:tetratricopeptide repeat protein [Anaerolineae bacterium]